MNVMNVLSRKTRWPRQNVLDFYHPRNFALSQRIITFQYCFHSQIHCWLYFSQRSRTWGQGAWAGTAVTAWKQWLTKERCLLLHFFQGGHTLLPEPHLSHHMLGLSSGAPSTYSTNEHCCYQFNTWTTWTHRSALIQRPDWSRLVHYDDSADLHSLACTDIKFRDQYVLYTFRILILLCACPGTVI